MRKPALIFGAILMFFLCVQPSNAQDKIELFGGYSYVHAPAPAPPFSLGPCPIAGCTPVIGNARANTNGWDLTGAVKVHKWISVAADFGGYYGSNSDAGNFRLNTYMVGPQFSLPGRFSPFVHMLFGVAHESSGAVSGTAFSSAFGGGLDLRLNRFASIRIAQVDLLGTTFGSGQAVPRVSTGFVLHF